MYGMKMTATNWIMAVALLNWVLFAVGWLYHSASERRRRCTRGTRRATLDDYDIDVTYHEYVEARDSSALRYRKAVTVTSRYTLAPGRVLDESVHPGLAEVTLYDVCYALPSGVWWRRGARERMQAWITAFFHHRWHSMTKVHALEDFVLVTKMGCTVQEPVFCDYAMRRQRRTFMKVLAAVDVKDLSRRGYRNERKRSAQRHHDFAEHHRNALMSRVKIRRTGEDRPGGE